MKVLKFKEFIVLPEGTAFIEVENGFYSICIKGKTIKDKDTGEGVDFFFSVPMNTGEVLFDVVHNLEYIGEGDIGLLKFGSSERWGAYDYENSTFIAFEKEETVKYIEGLIEGLKAVIKYSFIQGIK